MNTTDNITITISRNDAFRIVDALGTVARDNAERGAEISSEFLTLLASTQEAIADRVFDAVHGTVNREVAA